MKRVALAMIAVVAASALALALSAAGTHDRTLVALQQPGQPESDVPRSGQNETTERRPRPIRANPRDQDQMLLLLLLLEMGSPASRR